jgi:hypothetical protein
VAKMAQGGVVVFGGRQPACILRLALRHFSSPPFYLFSSASTIASPRASLGGVFSALTALKILAIRQDACGFLPYGAKNPLANPNTSRC